MEAWIMACLFLLLGIAMTGFTRRLATSVKKGSLYVFKIAPWLNRSGKDNNAILQQWDKSIFHSFEVIWIWGIRIIGFIFIVGSILLIYVLISQS
jgi:hypothetical protein